MGVAVKEQLVDEQIAKSAVRSERVKKDYHSMTFDGQIISYYVFEEKFDLLQDRMLDNFHYLDDKIETVKSDLNTKIDGVETRLNEKIDKLDARVDKPDEKIEIVKNDLGQINSRLTLI
ncbi:BDR-repeat family protein (plasmid) [Borrelia hermsii YBT]|uniref:BDR-repeat family protein n=1 Tax=Borrelia hermsii YBT TaxID=1313295 RepID=W5T1M3_BORHE|nr:hypothetical protein [Borrelia hermsii]AHH13072.1 BDR-repeat family protein [Borrelia hermsii YBT]